MKTTLILVGKTVNKHFIAGINDYVERIGHYMPFDIAEKHQETHRAATEDSRRRTDTQATAAFRHGGAARRARQGNAQHRVCSMDRKETTHRTQTRLCDRRPIRLRRGSIQTGQRNDVPLTHDLLPPDGAPRVCGTGLQGLHHHQGRALPSRINKVTT